MIEILKDLWRGITTPPESTLATLSPLMKKIIDDPKARSQFARFMLNDEEESEIELSDGSKVTIRRHR